MTSFFDVNNKCKRKNTHGEQQPWFKILPPDGAQEENISAINIQHSEKKKENTEKG